MSLLIFSSAISCTSEASNEILLNKTAQTKNVSLDQAPRFNLTTISNNRWRVPDTMKDEVKPEVLSFRRETTGARALLIRSEAYALVFLYDPKTKQMTLSDEQRWQATLGKADECIGSLGNRDFTQPDYTAVLWKGDSGLDTPVRITGRYFWNFIASPSGKRLALISADGPYETQRFMLRGQILRGARYVEIFEMLRPRRDLDFKNGEKPQLKPVGQAVKINDPNESNNLFPCWTADEEFLFIPDWESPWVWIVQVNN